MRIENLDDLKLGQPALDGEHRALIDLCNEFIDSVHSGQPLAELTRQIGRLLLHTREHFSTEETLLDRHNYPGLAAHKAEHERLLTQADTLMKQFAALEDGEGAQAVIYEAATFLRTWLVEHIRTTDLPCRPFLMRLA